MNDLSASGAPKTSKRASPASPDRAHEAEPPNGRYKRGNRRETEANGTHTQPRDEIRRRIGENEIHRGVKGIRTHHNGQAKDNGIHGIQENGQGKDNGIHDGRHEIQENGLHQGKDNGIHEIQENGNQGKDNGIHEIQENGNQGKDNENGTYTHLNQKEIPGLLKPFRNTPTTDPLADAIKASELAKEESTETSKDTHIHNEVLNSKCSNKCSKRDSKCSRNSDRKCSRNSEICSCYRVGLFKNDFKNDSKNDLDNHEIDIDSVNLDKICLDSVEAKENRHESDSSCYSDDVNDYDSGPNEQHDLEQSFPSIIDESKYKEEDILGNFSSPLSPDSPFYANLPKKAFPQLTFSQVQSIFRWYFSQPLPPTAEMFPWLHGMPRENLSQRSFFLQKGDQVRKPNARFLMAVHGDVDFDGLKLLPNTVHPSEVLRKVDVLRAEVFRGVDEVLGGIKREEKKREKDPIKQETKGASNIKEKGASNIKEKGASNGKEPIQETNASSTHSFDASEMLASLFDGSLAETIKQDCVRTGLIPVFLDLDPRNGISLRNFHIQVAKAATLADFIVYSLRGEPVASYARLLWVAQRHEAVKEGVECRYNVFMVEGFRQEVKEGIRMDAKEVYGRRFDEMSVIESYMDEKEEKRDENDENNENENDENENESDENNENDENDEINENEMEKNEIERENEKESMEGSLKEMNGRSETGESKNLDGSENLEGSKNLDDFKNLEGSKNLDDSEKDSRYFHDSKISDDSNLDDSNLDDSNLNGSKNSEYSNTFDASPPRHDFYDVDFRILEKIETAKMSSASQISHQIWVGNSWDFQISIAHLHENDTYTSQTHTDPLLGLPYPKAHWRLFIRCATGASFPSKATLGDLLFRSSLSSHESHETSYTVLEFPPSGSIGIGDCQKDSILAVVNLCKLMYVFSASLSSEAHATLVFCTDGYTESSLLVLCFLMYANDMGLSDAMLALHITYQRPFYVFNTDVMILQKLEPFLRQFSPKKGNIDWRVQESLSDSEINLLLLGPHVKNTMFGYIDTEEDEEPVLTKNSWVETVEGSLPSRILPYLYLGSLSHANCLPLLESLGICSVISVGEQLDWLTGRFFRDNVVETVHNGSVEVIRLRNCGVKTVMRLKNLQDDGIDELGSVLTSVLSFIDAEKERDGKIAPILVHCRVGVSRSATVVIAEVMRTLGLSLPEAYLLVRVRRLNIIIQPNLRFMYELFQWEGKREQRRIDWFMMCREIVRLNKQYIY